MIVVTGAGGFIGRALLPRLRAAGLGDVLPAGRQGQPLALDLGAERIMLPAGTEAVVHLAGEKRDPARMAAVNAHGAERLAEAAIAAGARRFVHLSSVGVYGAPKHAGVVDESGARTPRGAYESSKDEGERRVRQRCAEAGLPCAVLQPSNVIGEDAQKRPLLGLVRAVASGRYVHIGPPRAWVNYVAVDDVAAALVHALGAAGSGTWIVNTGCRLEAMLGWIAAELGCAAPTRRLPLWLGAVAAQAGRAGRALLRRDLPFSPERFLEMTNTTRYDGGAITRELGFRYPVGIERTVRSLAAGYRRAGLA